MTKKIFINGRFLTQAFTGVQRYAYELVKKMDALIENGNIDKDKYKVYLIAPKVAPLHEIKLKNIILCRVGNLTGHFWEQFELPYYSSEGLLFCPGNTAPIFSLFSPQKVVVTLHSVTYLYSPEAYSMAFKSVYRLLVPLITKYSDTIISVSNSERVNIEQFYPSASNKIVVVQNGGLTKDFYDNLSDHEKFEKKAISTGYILFVGSYSKVKNLQGVINAIGQLNKYEDLSLVVVGGKSVVFDKLPLDIPKQIRNRIWLRGQVNDYTEMINLYKNATCLVFPSFFEASPLPPIEAMACSCPVIASAIPSLIERCGEAALYCDPNEPKDIAEKIKMVIEDRDLCDTLQRKGIECASFFTWDKCAKETFSVLEKVINR